MISVNILNLHRGNIKHAKAILSISKNISLSAVLYNNIMAYTENKKNPRLLKIKQDSNIHNRIIK